MEEIKSTDVSLSVNGQLTDLENFKITSITASNLSSGGSLTGSAAGGAFVAPAYTPLLGTDITTTPNWFPSSVPNGCTDYHQITEELLQTDREGQTLGICERCGVKIFIPRVAGAFSFERAGVFVGKAMSLDDEDDMGELLGELAELEDQIKRDQKRLERAREILQIARGMAKKHSVKQLAI
jgi:hypothetical protein